MTSKEQQIFVEYWYYNLVVGYILRDEPIDNLDDVISLAKKVKMELSDIELLRFNAQYQTMVMFEPSSLATYPIKPNNLVKNENYIDHLAWILSYSKYMKKIEKK